MSKLDELICCIGERNLLQKNYVTRSIQSLFEDEISDLETLISFYYSEGYSVSDIAESYLTFVQDSLKEQYFFLKNNFKYRYSKFEQVAKDVYFNPDYMKKYMVGLGISQYMWSNHIGLRRWFEQMIINRPEKKGDIYLEIGPGHRYYFTRAVHSSKYKECIAIDISQTSVKLTQRLLEFSRGGGAHSCRYNVICQDFFDIRESSVYNTIVMGEVLEHVEKPRTFLNKIYELSDLDTFIFVSTVVNAPAKDHIYLFRNKEEVFSMCNEENLSVLEYACFTANEIPLRKAEAEQQPIIIGLVLKK